MTISDILKYITPLEVIDYIIAVYLAWRIYKLLKGSLAFSIFVGVAVVYGLEWVVDKLDMQLLSAILSQVTSLGLIALIIVFQPEIRRFLLMLGQELFTRQNSLKVLFWGESANKVLTEAQERDVRQILIAIETLSEEMTGALLVFTANPNISETNGSSSVIIRAEISAPLLLSIFRNESPLHDGAVIMSRGMIHSAGCVLPISQNPEIPQEAGLRHRAALGVTENSNVFSFIVSEETGNISFARDGVLRQDLNFQEVEMRLREAVSKT